LALISLFFKFRNSKLGLLEPFLYIICSDSYDFWVGIPITCFAK
jgi:hypothetical protein